MRWGAVCLMAAILSGCGTKYQEMGLTGGVAAEPVMTDVYRIVARGNGYTPPDRVQDFTLLKAAETTLAAGGNFFVALNQTDRTKVDQTRGTAQTSVVGSKPGEALMIRVLRLKPDETPPPGAFPAQDIVNTIGPRLRPT
jgi:hypothetical protein